MTVLAIPWFVLQNTGSATQTGLVGACEAAGLVVSFVCAGPIVDLLGSRRASVLSDLAALAAVAAIPLLSMVGWLSLGLLVFLALVMGLSRAPGMTAQDVMLPDLVGCAGLALERATGMVDGVIRAARMLGAPLAGVLVVLIGSAQVLVVDAATFLVSALLVGLVVRLQPKRVGTWSPREYVVQQRTGFRYLGKDRLVLAFVLMVSATNALDAGWSAVGLPVYARNLLGSSVALGLLVAAFGAGAVVGSLLFGWLGPRLPRWQTFAICFLLAGAPRLSVYLFGPGLTMTVVATFLLSIGFGPLNPIVDTVFYVRVPPELRARVFAVLNASVLACVPVGALAMGVLVDGVGWFGATLVWAVLYLAATLCPFIFQGWRELNANHAQPLSPVS